MQLGDLKKSLFGYQKESVYSYIVSLEAEISNKYKDQLKYAEDELKKANHKIEELEGKLEKLNNENAALRENNNMITAIFSDAHNYSEDMIKEISTVKDTVPIQNLSLFRKKNLKPVKESVL